MTAVFFGIVMLLSLRRPAWAAGVIVMMFALEQVLQSFFPLLVTRPWVVNFTVGMMGVGAATLRYLRGEDISTGYFNPVFLLVVALYVYQVIGWTWSPGGEFAMLGMRRSIFYLTLYIVIAPALVRDLREFDEMMRFILVIGTILLLLILFNPRAGFTGARFKLELGEYGSQGNPLATGRAGGTIAIAAILMRNARDTTVLKFIRIAAFVVGMAMAILSGSRGQAFGAALVVVLLYPVARRVENVKQFFAVVGGFASVAALVYLTFSLFLVEENKGRFTTGTAEALEARWDRVSTMVDEFIARPEKWITGLGPGGFSDLTGGGYTHNVPTEVLVELGLIGVTIFVGLLLAIYFGWRKLHKAVAHDPQLRSASAILAGIFAYNFILSCKQGSIISAPGPILYFIIIGRVAWTFMATRRVSLEEDVEYHVDDVVEEDEAWGDYDYSEYGDFADYGENPDQYAPAT